ncbi:hypothetical protein ABT126_43365 [Streptomyces sp. NPDC002012]|uniref:hypothetical protein n=1 Tax=unclassified Streptomyces TaxID=2593676 RepID=UPI003327205F
MAGPGAPGRRRLLSAHKPHGTTAIHSIGEGHRTWVDSLPDFLVPTTVEENGQAVTRMLPVDKSRIFPYAYRHS